MGYGVGIRLLELGCFRDRAGRRDLHVLDALRFIHTPLWKSLFGHAARDLEQSNTVRGRRGRDGRGCAGVGGCAQPGRPRPRP